MSEPIEVPQYQRPTLMTLRMTTLDAMFAAWDGMWDGHAVACPDVRQIWQDWLSEWLGSTIAELKAGVREALEHAEYERDHGIYDHAQIIPLLRKVLDA